MRLLIFGFIRIKIMKLCYAGTFEIFSNRS